MNKIIEMGKVCKLGHIVFVLIKLRMCFLIGIHST